MTKKILFFGESLSLTHIVRPLMLAEESLRRGYSTVFACDEPYVAMLSPEVRSVRVGIQSVPSKVMFRRIAVGKPAFDDKTLQSYVEAELKLIRMIKPDLVVGDFRLSLLLSCRLLNVPYLNLTNIHWRPGIVERFPLPELARLSFLPHPFKSWLFEQCLPFSFRLHCRSFHRIARRFGAYFEIKTLLQLYTSGDFVFYFDAPFLWGNPLLRVNETFVGPMLWSMPGGNMGAELPTDRPLVYVCMGSSGRADLVGRLLKVLSEFPVNVALSTANRDITYSKSNQIFCFKEASAESIIKKAAFTISHGGTAQSHLSVSLGVPVLAIPNNLDMYLSMIPLVKAGAGIVIRSDRLNDSVLRTGIEALLKDPQFARRSRALSGSLQQLSPRKAFLDFLDEQFGRAQADRGASLRKAA